MTQLTVDNPRGQVRSMITTRVVNIRTTPCDVYIGRPSLFGNPFCVNSKENRMAVIEKYKQWFLQRVNDPEFRAAVESLRGKVLGCHCLPLPCHGHVIAAWLDGELT